MFFIKADDFEMSEETNFLSYKIVPKDIKIKSVVLVERDSKACEKYVQDPKYVKVDIKAQPLLATHFSLSVKTPIDQIPTKVEIKR